jgi:hypothetical protein
LPSRNTAGKFKKLKMTKQLIIGDLNNLNDRARSLYLSEHEENSSSDNRYYGPWITEITLFQACLPFVPPLSTVFIQIFNNCRKVEIVEEDKIFFVKIVDNT